MEDTNTLEFQDKQTIDVRVQNHVYAIRVAYSLADHQLSIDVEEKKAFEFYQAKLTNETLPEDLSFYSDVQTIFNYISQSPDKIISYNTLGKYILFFDYVSSKRKYSKIQLQKRVITSDEKKNIQIAKLTQEKQDLIEQVDHLRSQICRIKGNETKMLNDYLEIKRQRDLLQFRVTKHQEQVQILKRENYLLKMKYGISHSSEVQEECLLNNIRKMRKGQKEQLIVRKIFKEGEDYKYEKSEESKLNISAVNLQKQEKNYEFKESQAKIFQNDSADLVYYGTKFKYFIEEQPNKANFKIKQSTIEKVTDSNGSSLLYFSSQEKIYLQQKKQPRVFVEIRNTSQPYIVESLDFNVIIGIIAKSETALLNISQTPSAIYLNTYSSSIYLSGVDIKTNFIVSFKKHDIIRLVIDYQLHMLAYFLNDYLIGEVIIDSNIVRQGFYPFIELKAKNSCVQLL